MKNQFPGRAVSPVIYFLSSLFLLLCVMLPARAQLLPLNADIASTGGETYSSGTYVLTSTSTGIQWQGFGGVDKIHFTYQQVTGDVEIVARVVSFSNATPGQVGLTIRAGTGTADQIGSCFFIPNYWGLNTNALFVSTRGPVLDGNPNYYYLQGGGDTQHPTLNPPFWLKLVRIGNNYGSYWSLDGRDWFLMFNSSGSAFFPTGTYNAGLYVSSGSDTASSSATFDNVYVGAPRLKYKTSWIGNTSAGVAAGNAANEITSLWVKPDGSCYVNGAWNEGSPTAMIYKDGKVVHSFDNYRIGSTGAWEGTMTGNASNIFFYDVVGSTPTVYCTGFNTYLNFTPLTFAGLPLGDVRGLAASETRIFVSDYANGLVRIVDASTLTEIGTPISLPRCGPIAYDGTNFWVIQAATQDNPSTALSWHATGTYAPSILCYQPDGTPLPSRTITWTSPDVAIPTALAYQDLGTPGTTSDDRLWVCDNGPHQYVRCYTNLTGNPVAGTPFGQDGGLWAGSHPGQITDAAAGGDKRFYGPVGVGTDSSGNIYVACDGSTNNVTDLRKFTSTGTLVWRVNGLVFTDLGDFDPASDGQQIYLPERHFTMNYANTAPGTEWSYKGFTCNLLLNGNDIRNRSSSSYGAACGDKLARLGAAQGLYMYTTQQGACWASWLYYFNGETAMPFGSNTFDGTAPNYHRIWIDANLNGVVDPGEWTSTTVPFPGGTPSAFDVDIAGDIWMNFRGAPALVAQGTIRRILCQGTQTLTGGVVVPSYNLNPGGYIDYPIPSPLSTSTNVNYDRTNGNDTFYAIGQKADGTWALVRCDKWLANPDNQFNPIATWVVNLPQPSDLTMLFPPSSNFNYWGLDVVGGKIFVGEQYGPIHVYDAALGNPEIVLNPGPEISARTGWNDMSMGVNAFKRSTGEYVVTEEDSGWNAADVLYRWTPQADTAVDAAPMALTATAPGRKVVLSWAGSVGMVTSYKLYRSTSSGTETLYQSSITAPTFTDMNVVPGTTYYYKVTAVNAVGESAQSNEASATPLSTQVEFVKTDTTTQGTWYTGTTTPSYVYGSEGYEICNSGTPNYPAYATVTTPGTITGSWADPTSDVRGLRKVGSATDRIGAYRTPTGSANVPWSWNINFTDGKWHQVAVYMVDWTGTVPPTPHLWQLVQVLDAATGTVLFSRPMNDFSKGQYLVLNITGNVQIQLSNFFNSPGPIASGLFFDPVQVATPAIAWWKFDETSGTVASDSSGAGHNGTVSGTTWDPSGPLHLNGCVKIPGGTARVNLPNSMISGHMPISISAWFKTSSTTGAVIVGSTNAPSPSEWDPVLYVGADGKLRGTYYTNPGPTAYTRVMSSTATANNGQWHHAALVADGGTQALYLDGALVDYRAATFSATALAYNYLGYCNTNLWPSVSAPTNNFNGWLDDVRIYDKALTASQVFQLANP